MLKKITSTLLIIALITTSILKPAVTEETANLIMQEFQTIYWECLSKCENGCTNEDAHKCKIEAAEQSSIKYIKPKFFFTPTSKKIVERCLKKYSNKKYHPYEKSGCYLSMLNGAFLNKFDSVKFVDKK